MLANKESLLKALSEPIILSDAPARGLRLQLGLLPDQSDVESFASGEVLRRVEALDAYYGLDRNTAELGKQRLKAIFEYAYGVPADSSDWEIQASVAILMERVVRISALGGGRPEKWTRGALIVLYADVWKLKAQCPELKGDYFWEAVRARHHRTWGQFSKATLRKAHVQAKRIVQQYSKSPAMPNQT